MKAEGPRVSLTVDVEGDFGTDHLRGVDEAMPWLLDLFAESGVRATFFCTGLVARKRPEFLQELARSGHVVASHSDTHPAFSRVDAAARDTELRVSKQVIEDATGVACVGFRAPYFDLPADLGPALQAAGYRWSSSKAPFSPIAKYRHVTARRPHQLPGSDVHEFPVPGWAGLPLPEGVSWRRLFWPLTAIPVAPPSVFYLHPYDLLEGDAAFTGPKWRHALMTFRGGAWARTHLRTWLAGWKQAGARFEPAWESTVESIGRAPNSAGS